MVKQGSSPLDDPLNILLIGILKGFTTSMWRVSGEGSGGVSRAFGEDLWNLMNARAVSVGVEMDKSTPESAMVVFSKFLTDIYQSAEEIEYEVGENSLEMTVKNCKLHDLTDFLDENNVPRSVGCPYALTAIALMEDVTGEPFIIDNIKSENGNSKIVIKQL
jgi:hypothetical protein